jgi:pantoate--beta-alanine ligase
MAASGERSAEKIMAAMRSILLTAEDARIDYAAIVDADTLEVVETVENNAIALLAVKIENTRLIDNGWLRK